MPAGKRLVYKGNRYSFMIRFEPDAEQQALADAERARRWHHEQQERDAATERKRQEREIDSQLDYWRRARDIRVMVREARREGTVPADWIERASAYADRLDPIKRDH